MKLLIGCWTWREPARGFLIKLAGGPNPIMGYPSAFILLFLIPVDLHVAGDGLDMLKKFSLEFVFVAGIRQLVGANLINQTVRSVPAHQDVFRRGQCFLWPITKIDQPRRNKKKYQDERHHHVVMEAASGIGPEQIAFENTLHFCRP